ncbi:MAG TPA: glycosyltransferase 87 family protein [Jatrophihabitans sp.]|nr:glycosyltransferase 87 family protein [Jatrophihabitans sp.]
MTLRRAAPVLVLAASIAALLVVRVFANPSSLDLIIYRGEGVAVRTGQNLFDAWYGIPGTGPRYHATYPPFAALLFVPLSYLTTHAVIVIALVANIALLGLVVDLSRRLVGFSTANRVAVVCIGVAVLLWTEPVYTTLQNGQINLAVLALVLWDFIRPANSRWTGVGVGLAAGIKVTPTIFIVYLLLTRRFRAAVTATVTFAGTIAVSALVVPDATWQFWTKLVFDTGRVGRLEKLANQSIRGLVARIDHTRQVSYVELLVLALVAVAGLACAARAYRRFGDAWGVPTCAVTGLLVAPIAWTHHWVWCVPIALLLWQHERRAVLALAVFWTFIVWGVPGNNGMAGLHFDAVQTLLSGWYVAFGVAFLVGTALRAHSGRSGLPPPGTPQHVPSEEDLIGQPRVSPRGRRD